MKEKHIIALVTLAGLLSACANTAPPPINTTNLSSLESAYAVDKNKESASSEENSHLRDKILQDTAMGLGAQGGLAFTYQQINTNLEKDSKRLESIFNFNGMILSHGVLPPVLVESNNNLNQDDPDTIRISDKTYKIVAQARFATTAPNWREYLIQAYNKPEMPNVVLLPKSKEERQLWAKNIRLGWDKGEQQAYSIFQQNLARLKRDYKGMILYRKLLQQNIISAPYVSKTELGITGNGDDMHVNDQVLRITVHPKLQTNSEGWRAIVVKNDG